MPAKTTKAQGSKKAAKVGTPALTSTPKTPATPAKRISALDAAHAVLAKEGKAINAQDLVKAMSEAGLWTSPGGKTPHATLYSAILREIATKGPASRFRKASKGHFEAAA